MSANSPNTPFRGADPLSTPRSADRLLQRSATQQPSESRYRRTSHGSVPQNASSQSPNGTSTTSGNREGDPAAESISAVADANIVIFGETSVGKLPVVNLIANQAIAHTLNDAIGRTVRYKRYPIVLDGISCALWDIVRSEGTVPARETEDNLKALIQVFARYGGIHLVIYCIRGPRLTKALKRNYELFYVTACRKKVPVALAVTGLEYQEEGMESWWTENQEGLRRDGMWFDAHACVTTLDVEDEDIQKRRSASREMLRALVVKYSELPGWKADASIARPVSSRIFFRTSGNEASDATAESVVASVPTKAVPVPEQEPKVAHTNIVMHTNVTPVILTEAEEATRHFPRVPRADSDEEGEGEGKGEEMDDGNENDWMDEGMDEGNEVEEDEEMDEEDEEMDEEDEEMDEEDEEVVEYEEVDED